MSIWRSTIWYEFAPASPNEKWGHGGSSMQRQVDILDGSFRGRIQAAYDFVGYQVSTGSYIHRVVPMAYPALALGTFVPADNIAPLPDTTNKFFVQAISRTQPIAAPAGVDPVAIPIGTAASNYQRARLTLECVTVPYIIIDDTTLMAIAGTNIPDEGSALAKGWQYTRYVTRHREAFCRLITIPYGMLQTNAGSKASLADRKPVKMGIPFREGGEHRIYTWMRVPLTGPFGSGVNFGRIESAIGMINNAPFDGAAYHTLLLDSISTREYQGAFGEWLADVTFNMIFLPHVSSGNRFLAWQVAVDIFGEQAAGPAPTNAAGVILTKGVFTGWDTVVDVDYNGNWDYYDVRTAKVVDNQITDGTRIYTDTDFSAFFRP